MAERPRKKPGRKPKPPEEKVARRGIQPPNTKLCPRCQGVGKTRDKKFRRRKCTKCNGTGRVPK